MFTKLIYEENVVEIKIVSVSLVRFVMAINKTKNKTKSKKHKNAIN